MASLCLTTYGFSCLHLDDRPHPTTAGRADGIQPRTIEVLRNIGAVKKPTEKEDQLGREPLTGGGLAKKMISQGVRWVLSRVRHVSAMLDADEHVCDSVYEVAFWDPTPEKQLARTSRAPSCPSFIDIVDNYTLLLHQGMIENAFLDEIEAVSPWLSVVDTIY